MKQTRKNIFILTKVPTINIPISYSLKNNDFKQTKAETPNQFNSRNTRRDFQTNLLKSENTYISNVNKILAKSHVELQARLNRVESTSFEKKKNSKNYDKLKLANDRLQKELKISSQTNNKLSSCLINLERKSKEINELNKKLKNELNSIKKQCEVEIEFNDDQKDKSENIVSKSAKSESEYQSMQKKINELYASNKNIIESNAKLEKEKENKKKELSQYESLIENYTNTLNALSNEDLNNSFASDAKEILDQKQNEITQKEETIQSLIGKCYDLKQSNDEKLHQLSLLNQEFNEKKQVYSQVDEMKTEFDGFLTKVNSLTEISNNKDKTIEQLKMSLKSINNLITEESQIVGEEDGNHYEQLFKKELETKKEIEKSIEEINKKDESVINARDKTKLAYENVIDSLKAAINKVNSNSPEIEKLKEENKKLKEKNLELKNKIKIFPKLEEKYNEILKENEELFDLEQEIKKLDKLDISSTKKNEEKIIYTLYRSRLLCYNIFQRKYFFYFKTPSNYDNFLSDYLPHIEGTLIANAINGLFILTGKEHNNLYYFSHKSSSIKQFIKFNYNHKYGGLIFSRGQINLLCIGGAINPKVEMLSFDTNKITSLPDMRTERANGGYVFLQTVLYVVFGFNYLTKKYINTIEYLDIEKGTEWKELKLEVNNPNICSLKGLACICISMNEFLITGGIQGEEEIPNQKIGVINTEDGSFELSEEKIGKEKDEFLFGSNKHFISIIDENVKDQYGDAIVYKINLDDNGNFHLLGNEFEYMVESFKEGNYINI